MRVAFAFVLISSAICDEPLQIYPESYDIELTVDPENNKTFSGFVKIDVNFATSSDKLSLLISERTTIESISVKKYLEKDQLMKSYVIEEESMNEINTVEVKLTETVNLGTKCVVEVKYSVQVQGSRSLKTRSYANNTKHLAALNFLNRGRAEISPCVYRVGYKSTITLNLVHPEKYRVAFGMPETSKEKQGNGMVRTSFLKTPSEADIMMPFFIFELKEYNNKESMLSSIPISIYSDDRDMGALALKYLEKALIEAEKHFGFKPENLPKVSLILMSENLDKKPTNGMILAGSRTLIIKEELNEIETWISHAAAYAAASIWMIDIKLGDIWTLPAKNDEEKLESALFLKDDDWMRTGLVSILVEHFADRVTDDKHNFMDEFVVAKIQPKLGEDDSTEAAILADFLKTRSGVNHDTRVKAASIHRMFFHTLGPIQSREAIRSYIKKYSLEEVTPEYMYREFEIAAKDINDVNMSAVFDSWIQNKGFPLVTAIKDSGTKNVVLNQTRYNIGDDDEIPYQWWIPISWTSESSKDFKNIRPKSWIEPNSTQSLTLKKEDDWYIINLQQMGYYRVNYDEENWMRLAGALKKKNHDEIPELTRARLINDATELAFDYKLNITYAMEILIYLKTETDYLPWMSAKQAFDNYFRNLPDLKQYSLLKKFVVEMAKSAYEKVGFYRQEGDDLTRRKHRGVMINLLCQANDESVIEKSRKALQESIDNPEYEIDTDIEYSVYCCGIKKLDQAVWDKIFNRALNEESSKNREKIFLGLSCSDDHEILRKYLKTLISNNTDLQYSDTLSILKYCTESNEDITVDFLIENFEALINKIGEYSAETIVATVAEECHTQKSLDKLGEFKKKYKSILSDIETIDLTLEEVKSALKWINNVREDIGTWLIANL